MQVLTTLLLTMATLLLLLNAVKPLPVLPVNQDETSMQQLRDLPVEQHQQRKRICGMSWIGCDKSGKRWMPFPKWRNNADDLPYRK